ncbi:hypothetical protein MA16_Dca025286 [Dendrobium catenatum]|uniref:Uncharacterized protein n=1 Tax=Dendrobium catenatum TaxID=906689 RepID=A0A2I0WNA3_9ASPA|nr:hypothetical protein MA16_Dca025286 [Dendrobium catenatum]
MILSIDNFAKRMYPAFNTPHSYFYNNNLEKEGDEGKEQGEEEVRQEGKDKREKKPGRKENRIRDRVEEEKHVPAVWRRSVGRDRNWSHELEEKRVARAPACTRDAWSSDGLRSEIVVPSS